MRGLVFIDEFELREASLLTRGCCAAHTREQVKGTNLSHDTICLSLCIICTRSAPGCLRRRRLEQILRQRWWQRWRRQWYRQWQWHRHRHRSAMGLDQRKPGIHNHLISTWRLWNAWYGRRQQCSRFSRCRQRLGRFQRQYLDLRRLPIWFDRKPSRRTERSLDVRYNQQRMDLD